MAEEPPATSDNAAGTAAELAREIKQRRKDAGLSQIQLALRAGYTHQYVSLAERSGNLPSQDLVQALDTALNAGGALLALRKQAKAEQRARRRTISRAATNLGGDTGEPTQYWQDNLAHESHQRRSVAAPTRTDGFVSRPVR